MASSRQLLATLALVGGAFAAAPAAADPRSAAGEVYQLRCAACHGTAGQGTRAMTPPLGPALKGNPFVVNGSIPAISQVIRKGRTGQRRLYNDVYGNMIGFGQEMVPDIEQMSLYLKNDLQK